MMEKIIFKNISSRVLVLLVLAINTGSVYLLEFFKDCKPVGAILSSFTIVLLSLYILDKWLWKWPPLKYLYNLKDISGVYEGDKNYEYYDQDEKKVKTGTMKEKRFITQTASFVIIETITYNQNGDESSRSKSSVDNIELEKDGNLKITLTYHNKGSMTMKFPPHDGTEILNFTDNGEILGNYYTNRQPFQTRGTVKLTKKL